MSGIDDQDEGEDSTSDSTPPTPTITAPASASTAQAPLNPTVAAYFQNIAQNKQDMADAQQKANTNLLISGLGRAGSTLAQSGYGNTNPIDTSAYDDFDKAAQAPVQQLLSKQKSQKAAIDDAADESKTAATIQDHDPNSPQSKAVQDLAKKLYRDKFTDDQISHITAADSSLIFKPIELHEKIQENSQNRSDKAQDKLDQHHEEYVKHIEDQESKWRGDPATSRFDQNLASISTADAILAKYRGHEDDMPVQDIHALVSDKLKAMTGGVPTDQEVKAQMPNTLWTKFSGVKSMFTGDPEAANAGSYVRNLDQYFKDMEAKSLSGLRNRQATVASNPKLTPEERARLVQIGVPRAVYSENQVGTPSGDAASTSDTVSVVSPQGVQGKIPRSKLNQALQRGFKQNGG